MKITVTDAVGKNTSGGIIKIIKEVSLEVQEGATIDDMWQEGKRAIGKVPFEHPIINRHEIKKGETTIVVPSMHVLKEGDVLHFVFC